MLCPASAGHNIKPGASILPIFFRREPTSNARRRLCSVAIVSGDGADYRPDLFPMHFHAACNAQTAGLLQSAVLRLFCAPASYSYRLAVC